MRKVSFITGRLKIFSSYLNFLNLFRKTLFPIKLSNNNNKLSDFRSAWLCQK